MQNANFVFDIYRKDKKYYRWIIYQTTKRQEILSEIYLSNMTPLLAKRISEIRRLLGKSIEFDSLGA